MSLAHIPLSAVPRGAGARIVRLNIDGDERRRLMDLGFVPGTVVTPAFTSPLGDPTAYEVRGAVTSLRRSQADRVEVRLEPTGGDDEEP